MSPADLAALLEDPERVLDLSPSDAGRLLMRLAPVVEALRLVTARIGARTTEGAACGAALLTAAEAGARLGLSSAQVYRRADRWPFTRRLGPKTLRFDPAGLERYLGRNKSA